MKDIKSQKVVLLWPEEHSKALSHGSMVIAHNHLTIGDFLKPGWD